MSRALPILLALAIGGCATLRARDPFRMPDGRLNVPKIVQWVSYGIDADCQVLGSTPVGRDVCTFGHDAYDVAQAAIDKNPNAAAAGVSQALRDLLDRIGPAKASVAGPYINWAITLLSKGSTT